MAEETSIARARREATEKRERRERKEAAAKSKPAVRAPEESPSLIDRIRKAFSSEDDINRIDTAVDAVDSGVKDANKAAKRGKKK